MGDYVGLMESFARDLGISRFELPGYERRSGPVVPARYTLLAFQTEARQMSEAETAITLDSSAGRPRRRERQFCQEVRVEGDIPHPARDVEVLANNKGKKER